MAIIYKYELEPGRNKMDIPLMQLLDIQEQNGRFVFWGLVNPEGINKYVSIKMFWTGEEIPNKVINEYDYFKTIQDHNGLVWHVFTRIW